MSKICVIGDAFIDIIIPKSNLIRGGVVINNDIKMSIGGTANVAIWLSRLGIKSYFIGTVGNDPFGEFFKNTLKEENVEDLVIVNDDFETGLCISVVDNDERSFIVKRGANDAWTEKLLEFEDIVGRSKIVYTTAYSLVSKRNKNILEFLLTSAKRNGSEIWLNLASHNIIASHKELILKIIREFADAIIMNQNEALTLCGSVDDVFSILRDNVSLIVITLGKNGCKIYSNKHNDIIYRPAYKVIKCKDVTGAGDAFAAGFIAKYLNGFNIEKCGDFGNKLASEVIQRFGSA